MGAVAADQTPLDFFFLSFLDFFLSLSAAGSSSAGLSLMLFFLSPYVFSFVFGKEWQMAGDFTQILAVLFFFKFISSPLSYMFNIAEKQHLDMLWQIGLFIVTIISFYIGVQKEDIKLALICFTAAYSFMYIINLYLSYSFSKGSTSRT